MVRCYALDDRTEAALSQQLGMPVNRASGPPSTEGALEAALQSDATNLVVLLPSGRAGRVMLARFKSKLPAAAKLRPTSLRDKGSNTSTASGFLGLTDEFYEPEPPKKWWQKILD